MKPGIHPNYVDATVTCSCGNTWTTRSTKPAIRTDLCSQCHPFFTGEQRIVDTAGQVERFMNKLGSAQEGGAVSKKQVRREQKMAETQRARTFTPELEALAHAGDTPAGAATPTA
ncbi:MAG: 50S ribosomal protein L31 [Chloroflexota bacterium]|nr:50S ribosomal protein L31 [Chloroflexota bacterium]